MTGYYDQKLAAERLRRVYEIAPPRVQKYLQAEIDYVRQYIKPGNRVLELGCGYGRVLATLTQDAAMAVGIDTSMASLKMAGHSLPGNAALGLMEAVALSFADDCFDLVACVQNGISAFDVNQRQLISEAMRVTRPGGTVLFSSYSERFWEHRMAWFELQARHGLLGAIDYDRTGEGVIVCHDGFRATTVSSNQFRALAQSLGLISKIEEVDSSSLFCILSAP
jgi:ubiquinone/menaquinone biosynthesis C-methylase UbiE